MSWTLPKTWPVGGGTRVAAELNEQIRDNIRYLKGTDGDTVRDAPIILEDQDGTPVGHVMITVKDEVLMFRTPADDGYIPLIFESCPTGTGAGEIAIGNHTH